MIAYNTPRPEFTNSLLIIKPFLFNVDNIHNSLTINNIPLSLA
jgi:hypothetical protein